jgi:hypothetical protein
MIKNEHYEKVIFIVNYSCIDVAGKGTRDESSSGRGGLIG